MEEIGLSQITPLPKEMVAQPHRSLKDKMLNPKITLEERLMQQERIHVVRATDDSGIDPRVVSYYDYFSPMSEQYRTLRTNIKAYLKKMITTGKLKMTRPAGSPRILTITSSMQGEGKTVTTANLGVSLAHDFENKVLLVDCDLRRGSLGRVFNIKTNPGLCDVLTGTVEISKAIQPTKINNLFIIPEGDALVKPSELLGSKNMRAFIERLKNEAFNYILIDTPPLIPFTDAGILGAQTDGVLLVVQARKTQAHNVKKAKDFLDQTHSRILGFVLTHADYSHPDFYGDYYYYYTNQKHHEHKDNGNGNGKKKPASADKTSHSA
jgi:capsular exopolysaccharide synthesis family protein